MEPKGYKIMTRYNIAINGYGRIGRCVLRALYESKRFYEKFNLIAINEIADMETIYHVTKFDSTHGMGNLPWVESNFVT